MNPILSSASRAMNPAIDFHQVRQNMVDGQIRTNKVTDHALIAQLRKIPREIFVEPHQSGIAYIDEDIPLIDNRFLLEPMIQARLIQSADLKPADLVLDVGCASGYSSALMAGLCGHVIGIDQSETLIKSAQSNHLYLGIENSSFAACSMLDGYRIQGPYDVIIVNGSLAKPPENLLSQLKDKGRLYCIIKDPGATPLSAMQGKAMIYEKNQNIFSGRVLFDAGSPYLENPQSNNKFIF